MEELLIALVLWIGSLIARAYRKIAGWLDNRQGRSSWRDRSGAGGGAGAGAGAGSASDAATGARTAANRPAAAQDPYRPQREALAARTARLRARCEEEGSALGRAAPTEAIGHTLRAEVAPMAEQTARALAELPPGAAGVVGLERLTERLDQLERLRELLLGASEQRQRDSDRSLEAADRLAEALYGPFVRLVSGGAGAGAGSSPPRPLALRGSRSEQPFGLFARTSLAPIALPKAFPIDPLHFAPLASEVGRDLLERVPGLRWELRSRLGLPDRYPVPFAFRGYFGNEEVFQPWGAWLDVGFGDMLATLLLGPAYGWACVATYSRPDQPDLVARVPTSREGAFYAPTPPPHLRLVLVRGVLETMGFGDASEELALHWRTRHHGGPAALYLPSRLQGFLGAPLGPFEQVARRLGELLATEPLESLGGQSLAQRDGVAFLPRRAKEAEELAVRLASQSDARSVDLRATDLRLALAAALLLRARGATRAERLGRWLLDGALPETRAQDPSRASHGIDERPRGRLGRLGRREQACEYRDAIILEAVLSRRQFGEPVRCRR